MRDQSESAAEQLWIRYFPKLVRVAKSTLGSLPHRSQDAQDAAQSAFVSFWRKLSVQDVATTLDRNSLWRLLATITARKARQIVRREFAEKRGAGQVIPVSQLGENDTDLPASELFQQLPTQEFDLACEERLQQLPEDLRLFAVLRLFGHTNAEISVQLECSERKVERKLNLIRSYWTDIQ